MGKEAAVLMPSGTMANLAAVLSWTRPADEVVLEAEAHLLYSRRAGSARWPASCRWECGGTGRAARRRGRASSAPPGPALPADPAAVRGEHPQPGRRHDHPGRRDERTARAVRRAPAGPARRWREDLQRGGGAGHPGGRARRRRGLGVLRPEQGTFRAGRRDAGRIGRVRGQGRRARKMLGGGMRQAGIVARRPLHCAPGSAGPAKTTSRPGPWPRGLPRYPG